jgi:hypothetical protein
MILMRMIAWSMKANDDMVVQNKTKNEIESPMDGW